MRCLLRVSLLLLALLQLNTIQRADESRVYSYQVRAVRIRGQADVPGAALGAGQDNGQALLPQAERWGSSDQVTQISDLLGHGVAEPVTGLLITPDTSGRVTADRVVYAGDQTLHLSFKAQSPSPDKEMHDLTLRIFRKGTAEPLIDAHLIAHTSRTTAIATPLRDSSDWLVVGITPTELEAGSAQESEKAFLLDESFTAPELVTRVEPEVPGLSKLLASEDERVAVEVIIDRDGSVRSPVVVRIPGDGEDLVIAALEAVVQWRWKPATKNGVPVPVYVTIVLHFRNNPDPPDAAADAPQNTHEAPK